MSIERRVFLLTVAASTSALSAGVRAQSLVNDKDPQAQALGYVADASKVDTKKYPKFVAGQNCTNCSLYQG